MAAWFGPTIRFGSRGEDIYYEAGGRSVAIGFTWVDGARLYLDGLTRWSDGAPIEEDERRRLFIAVLAFLRKGRDLPIVVINTDDPSRALWDQLCAQHRSAIREIEYTSDSARLDFYRQMHLKTLRAGKSVSIDGVEIRTEEDLERELLKYLPERKKK